MGLVKQVINKANSSVLETADVSLFSQSAAKF